MGQQVISHELILDFSHLDNDAKKDLSMELLRSKLTADSLKTTGVNVEQLQLV